MTHSPGGGWKARSLVDHVVRRALVGDEPDILAIVAVLVESSGLGARAAQEKIESIIGMKLEVAVPAELGADTWSLSNLEELRLLRARRPWDGYVEEVCALLEAPRNGLAQRVRSFRSAEVEFDARTAQEIPRWSWPMLADLLEIKTIPTPMSHDVAIVEPSWGEACWRRWFYLRRHQLALVFGPGTSQPLHQGFVWRMLHDATHLLQLAVLGGDGNSRCPITLAKMEAIALLSESRALDACRQIAASGRSICPGLDEKALRIELLLGLAERALRVAFDVDVHLEGQQVIDWVRDTAASTGLPAELLSFATEFHGLPGMASSYWVGPLELGSGGMDISAVLSSDVRSEVESS